MPFKSFLIIPIQKEIMYPAQFRTHCVSNWKYP